MFRSKFISYSCCESTLMFVYTLTNDSGLSPTILERHTQVLSADPFSMRDVRYPPYCVFSSFILSCSCPSSLTFAIRYTYNAPAEPTLSSTPHKTISFIFLTEFRLVKYQSKDEPTSRDTN